MSVPVKVLVVIGCSLAACVLFFVPAFFLDGDAAGTYGNVLLVAPFVGSFLGGWLVSRDSVRGRTAWILGGGIGLGLVGLVLMFMILGLLLSAALDDTVGYCC